MQRFTLACWLVSIMVGCGSVQSDDMFMLPDADDAPPPDAGDDAAPPQLSLTVTTNGTGAVVSTPAGINCPGTCSASFDAGTKVTLTATPSNEVTRFTGWSDGCSGADACLVSLAKSTTVNASFNRRGVLYMIRDSDRMVQRMDPVSLRITDIGALGVEYALGDCAWDSANNTLYMVPRRGTNLYRIDVATGAATFIGTHGIVDMRALLFHPLSGIMYAHANGNLYTLNLGTGAATLVGAAGVGTLDALAWDPTRNRIVGVLSDVSGGTLYTVNPTNGAVTNIGLAGPLDDAGMAYDPALDGYWAVDLGGQLFQYNPNANMARNDFPKIPGGHTCLTFRP